MGITDHLTCLLRNLYAGQETTVRIGHKTTDWFQIGKGVHQGCPPAYLTYRQSTSCEMPSWMKHKLEIKTSRKNINNFRYADDTTLMAESEEELKSLLMKVKEESGKVGLKLNIQKKKKKAQHSENKKKLNIQKTKIMASSPITSWKIDGETVETVQTLFWGAPKSLQMVIAAMKLKDAYSLEGKL